MDEVWLALKEGALSLLGRFLHDLPAFLAPQGHCYTCFASFGNTAGFEELIKNQSLPFEFKTECKFGVNWYVIDFAKS